jgi:hypothetical protein
MSDDYKVGPPVTKEQWDLMNPEQQGYCTYMYSEWPHSRIPKTNPYQPGTREFADFAEGERIGVLDAQDSEG